MNSASAQCQSPRPTKLRATVLTTPSTVSMARNRFRHPPLSAIAPSTGAIRDTMTLAITVAHVSRAVTAGPGSPALQ